MLTYMAMYKSLDTGVHAEVLDFPDVTAFGPTMADARINILSSLRYAAERRLREGQVMPLPQPDRMAPDAYSVEVLTVLPYDDSRVEVQTAR